MPQEQPRAHYHDRTHAGRALGARLGHLRERPDLLVLALPRGGVPVAAEVARALDAPLDVFLVRKLGIPGHPECAFGAIATGGVRVIDEETVLRASLTPGEVETVARREGLELLRRERAYRGDRPAPRVLGRPVVLVDDGLATGASMRAAVQALRAEGPSWLVVAVPVAPVEACEAFGSLADEVVCAATPEPFVAVGLWYEDFSQTSDDEVRAALAQAAPGPTPFDRRRAERRPPSRAGGEPEPGRRT